MTIDPAEPAIGAKIAGRPQFSAIKIDGGCNPSGMEIVDCAIVADGHSKRGADQLGLATFIEAGEDADCRQGAIVDRLQVRMVANSRLDQQRRLDGPVGESGEQRLTIELVARAIAVAGWTDPIPSLGAAAAAAGDRFHEQV